MAGKEVETTLLLLTRYFVKNCLNHFEYNCVFCAYTAQCLHTALHYGILWPLNYTLFRILKWRCIFITSAIVGKTFSLDVLIWYIQVYWVYVGFIVMAKSKPNTNSPPRECFVTSIHVIVWCLKLSYTWSVHIEFHQHIQEIFKRIFTLYFLRLMAWTCSSHLDSNCITI